MYEVLTAIGVVNTRLQKEVKDLMRGYREQDKGYNDFDMEEEEEVYQGRYAPHRAARVAPR